MSENRISAISLGVCAVVYVALALYLEAATPKPKPLAAVVEDGACHYDPTLPPLPLMVCAEARVGRVSDDGKYKCLPVFPEQPPVVTEGVPPFTERLVRGVDWLALYDCPTSIVTRAQACEHQGGCTVRCKGSTCGWYHSTRAAL